MSPSGVHVMKLLSSVTDAEAKYRPWQEVGLGVTPKFFRGGMGKRGAHKGRFNENNPLRLSLNQRILKGEVSLYH